MPYTLFYSRFPDVAERETRTVTVLKPSKLNFPPARYTFLEMFCDEPGCDCRRVFFSVVSSLRKEVEAVIAWGWGEREFYVKWMGDDDPLIIDDLKGPVLNLASPQSNLAPALLDLFREYLLQDTAYIERVKRHYDMFRRDIDNKAKRGVRKKKRKKRKRKKRKVTAMPRKIWVYDPQVGGKKIPDAVKPCIRQRILMHAQKHYAGKFNRIEVLFRGKFCYIDAYTEPFVPPEYDPQLYGGKSRNERIAELREIPIHLCRLRYFGDEDRWSMAFYTYSHEKYEPCFFDNGTWHGTPEEAFDTSAVYLIE